MLEGAGPYAMYTEWVDIANSGWKQNSYAARAPSARFEDMKDFMDSIQAEGTAFTDYEFTVSSSTPDHCIVTGHC